MGSLGCQEQCRGFRGVVFIRSWSFWRVRTAIAHSIREQTLTHLNCLSVSGYSFDGSAIQDEDLRTSFLPALSSEIRLARTKSEVEAFTPRLVELTELEIDKLDKERERASQEEASDQRKEAPQSSRQRTSQVSTNSSCLGSSERNFGSWSFEWNGNH